MMDGLLLFLSVSILIILFNAASANEDLCAFAERIHLNYQPDAFCPDLIPEEAGAHASSFSNCKPLPQRRCVHQIPDNFIEPKNQNEFLFDPPSNNVRLSMPGARFPDFKGFAERKNEDCVTCWLFQDERRRWDKFLNFIEVKMGIVFRDGPVRTALDFGSGTGGFLAALAERGVRGLGFARNWRKLPYLETAAARGVLVMHMDFRNQVPMAPGAVDLVHCSWLMNVLKTRAELEAMLMEWDRLVRPGGFVVQYGFRNADRETYLQLLLIIENTSKFLQWKQLHWNAASGTPEQPVLYFIFQKPLRRTSLQRLDAP